MAKPAFHVGFPLDYTVLFLQLQQQQHNSSTTDADHEILAPVIYAIQVTILLIPYSI